MIRTASRQPTRRDPRMRNANPVSCEKGRCRLNGRTLESRREIAHERPSDRRTITWIAQHVYVRVDARARVTIRTVDGIAARRINGLSLSRIETARRVTAAYSVAFLTQLRISAEADHLFRSKPITYFGPSRSPVSVEAVQGVTRDHGRSPQALLLLGLQAGARQCQQSDLPCAKCSRPSASRTTRAGASARSPRRSGSPRARTER